MTKQLTAFARLLFATTNHIERLDPALSRPGRMDVWVNFTNATKWQAEGIFKCFFPCKKVAEEPETTPEVTSDKSSDVAEKNLPVSKRKATAHAIPLLEENELNELAKRFADQIPDNEMSVRMNFIFDIFISRPRVYKDQFELTSFWIRVRYE